VLKLQFSVVIWLRAGETYVFKEFLKVFRFVRFKVIIVKKLNSLKHLVRTTVAESHKTANMKKALLLSSTSPFSQCADK